MKKLIVLCLLLAGCGNGDKLVEIHHVEQAVIDSMCDESYRCDGYAKWHDDEPYDTCDIYVRAPAQYRSEYDYHAILGHELRHCFSGEFH